MLRQICLTVVAVATVCVAVPAKAGHTPQQVCAIRSQGVYGFQCQGSASPYPGAPLEPVTFIGTVEGRYDAFWEGYGTFNSSLGSASTHVAGDATFDTNCFGRVTYSINEVLLPGGGTFPLPPLVIDFVPVDNFNEVLGMPVADPPEGVGDAVPRMTCRLVRIKKN